MTLVEVFHRWTTNRCRELLHELTVAISLTGQSKALKDITHRRVSLQQLLCFMRVDGLRSLCSGLRIGNSIEFVFRYRSPRSEGRCRSNTP
ncbi:hypothetical protein SISNIDRAFT_228471 [Sistotremastrum niveocremeum HHB9708]|uniref:Uncharacterized protein n=1 Tax=Sistotremastrum niveocremeum HHB9708 TaxID=1314777 RepID=A0A164Q545_9AGAM|nr:hypothetical protein SISNIDRAFT_228471 [Sistotremastrum niveocremeum HHB9708]